MLPPKTAPPAQLYDTLPIELRAQRQWVVYRNEKRGGKWTKVPYTSRTGRRADTTDPETWATHEEAIAALESGKYAGIGYVFSEGDPFTGVDLDECVTPETSAVSEWAWEWVDAFASYAEISPSGTGLHIVMRGHTPGRKNQRAGVEAYSSARFFTITGDAITGGGLRELPDRQDVLDRLATKYFSPQQRRSAEPPPTATEPVDLEDRELLEKARKARNGQGERFVALYDQGDYLEHASHSEARHELLRMLAFWTAWDAARMSRLYEGSALYHVPGYARKWARLGDRECRNAITATPRAYRQPARAGKEDGGELVHVIAALKAQAAHLAWEGRGGPTDSAVYNAIVNISATYGSMAKKGIIVSADLRTLALEAGTSIPTIRKALLRLREDRNLLRLSKKSTGTRAAVYLLRYPDATQGLHTNLCEDYVQPLSQLRNPGPATDKEFDKNGRKLSQGTRFLLRRLGKLSALVVGRVAVAGSGGITVLELARALERRPYNLRRTLKKVLDAGLVVDDGEGRLAAPSNLEQRLRAELEASGCDDAKRRNAVRYTREREAFRTRRGRGADQGPTDEDMERERLQRVQDALDVLQERGTGPAMILRSYVAGETRCFEYVVSAVAFHYGCASSDTWKAPVERAVELITEPRSGRIG